MLFGDVEVDIGDDHVATVRFHRPPNNFFDVALVRSLADAIEALDGDTHCRAIVLCSDGRHFCAGADLSSPTPGSETEAGTTAGGGGEIVQNPLYTEGVRLFAGRVPIVAAVQGAAVGGGLGLALVADFRVASPDARFSANFARLGFHHGFGLTVTLPAVIGQQRALELLYTGRRIAGDEALRIGLCDRLVDADALRAEAHFFARDIAGSGPLAVRSIRRTMRGDLVERVRTATDNESVEQARLRVTNDFEEGVTAMAERREPNFTGT